MYTSAGFYMPQTFQPQQVVNGVPHPFAMGFQVQPQNVPNACYAPQHATAASINYHQASGPIALPRPRQFISHPQYPEEAQGQHKQGYQG